MKNVIRGAVAYLFLFGLHSVGHSPVTGVMQVKGFQFVAAAKMTSAGTPSTRSVVQARSASGFKGGLFWELENVKVFERRNGHLVLISEGKKATLFPQKNTLVLQAQKSVERFQF